MRGLCKIESVTVYARVEHKHEGVREGACGVSKPDCVPGKKMAVSRV